MSDGMVCPGCGQPVAESDASCGSCGYALVAPQNPPDQAGSKGAELTPEELRILDRGRGGLHPLAPAVFVVVGIPAGILGTVGFGPGLGVAVGLLGGGIGVWALERARRLR